MGGFLTGSSFDASIFDIIVAGVTKVAGLFLVFPINLFLGVGILGVAIGVIKKMK